MSPISSNDRPIGGDDDFSRFKDGDHGAFRIYHKQHSPHVYRFAYSLTHNIEDAEDITAEAYAQLFNSRDNIKTSDNIRPFLFTVVRNLAYNLYKRQQVRANHAATLTPDDPDQIDVQFMNSNLINHLLKFLTPAQSEIMSLYREGLSTKEIAERLGITEQTVRNHKTHAINKWRILAVRMDFFLILLLMSPKKSENQYFIDHFSIGVQNISKKEPN